MKNYFFLLFFLYPPIGNIEIRSQPGDSQKTDKQGYISPKPFSFITNFPGDIVDYSQTTFNKNNLHGIAGMTAGTLALIVMDQQITDDSKIIGARLNIDPNSTQKKYFGKTIEVFSQRMYLGFEGPHDLSSAMYFLGDGWENLGIASGFLVHGMITKNNKSKQVANSILESVLTSGTVVQFIKHVTGRESPFVSTAPGGIWRFFPNQVEYHRHVPRYDAFPSGHIAAAMATVTVLSEYYPEKTLIKPIGYSLEGVLMIAMANNGIHWTSDYPLGIAIGYGLDKIAIKKNKKVIAFN